VIKQPLRFIDVANNVS